tara:strand:- start:363 stop:746 length:384 start_codon:yes stop_codon:yes gene_type:complete
MASELRVNTIKDASGNNSIATSIVHGGAIRAWFTLGVDAALDDSFNCSSVDDDGSGDFGIHFTANFNNALYSSSIGMTVTGLNDRYMVQSPSKASDAVEVRLMSTNDGSGTESNITHAEMKISGDPA